jgi:D-threo-aldose 1-dehydrogenase
MTEKTAEVPSVTLGNTGITTSTLGMGTWGFGPSSAPEARTDSDESIKELLDASFKAGVRLLDSAEAYNNEARLGKILAEMDTPDDLVISTKFGHGKGFGAQQFRESVERSLSDLRLDTIPIMMIHDPRTDEDMDLITAKGGALDELERMKDEGLITAIGVATGTFRPLERAVESDRFDCIQFPRGYHLLDDAGKRTGLFDQAKAKGMAVFNPGPFGANILATGAREGALYGYRLAFPEVIDAVKAMERRCAELGVTLPAAALAYSLTQPSIDVTVVGVRSIQELEWDLAALNLGLSRADLESIADAGGVDPALLGAPEYLRPWPADREPAKP